MSWKRLPFHLILVSFLFFSCAREKPTSEKLNISVSIAPLADLVAQIGGDQVDVFTITPPGINPHSFELSPGLMKKIGQSALLILNGAGLEYWAANIRDTIPNTKTVILAEQLELIKDHDGHHNEHDGGNPHVWLDPTNAAKMSESIYRALIELDPAHADLYEKNYDLLIARLDSLDSEIKRQVAGWTQKKFITFHPAWIYFARRYGLEQAAVIEARHGMQIGPKEVAKIIATTKRIGARVIFTEAQFPSTVAEMIARESDIAVVPLDPVGDGQMGYFEMMRYNVAQMRKGMK